MDADEIDVTVLMVFAIATDTLFITIVVSVVDQTAITIPDVSTMDFYPIAHFHRYTVGPQQAVGDKKCMTSV